MLGQIDMHNNEIYNLAEPITDTHAATNQTHQPTTEGQVRTPKDSACWLSQVWKRNELLDPSYTCDSHHAVVVA